MDAVHISSQTLSHTASGSPPSGDGEGKQLVMDADESTREESLAMKWPPPPQSSLECALLGAPDAFFSDTFPLTHSPHTSSNITQGGGLCAGPHTHQTHDAARPPAPRRARGGGGFNRDKDC